MHICVVCCLCSKLIACDNSINSDLAMYYDYCDNCDNCYKFNILPGIT